MAWLALKDGLELNYWRQADLAGHRAKLAVYLWAFGHYKQPRSVLEIGPGPLGGVLSLIGRPHSDDPNPLPPMRRVGVDPLADEYREAGLAPDDPSITMIAAHFEKWITAEKFDAIFSMDALDHGEMGFHLIPKIAGLLNPGGRFYLHVHLRTPEGLNESHDHALTLEQLFAALSGTDLVELRRDIYPEDVTGTFHCNALVGVWEKP